MNKKILIVLLLTLVSLIGIPGALAADQSGASTLTSTLTRQVTETSRVTETPRITETARVTATPRITETARVTATPRVTETSRVPTPVPEFPSIVLPIAAVIGLMMLLLYRRDK